MFPKRVLRIRMISFISLLEYICIQMRLFLSWILDSVFDTELFTSPSSEILFILCKLNELKSKIKNFQK